MIATSSSAASLLRLDMMENDPKRLSNIPSLVCALVASLTTGGTNYAFAVYANALKHKLNLTQSDLETISTAFYFSGLVTWIPGLLTDRFGTRAALSAGGLMGATTMMIYWMIATQLIWVHHSWLVPTLSFLGFVIFMSMGLIVGSVFKIIVGCCSPNNKGTIVGLAKGLVGLGAGTYTCIFQAIQQPEQSDLDFLPMAATLAILCVTLPALLLLPTRHEVAQVVFHDELTSRHIRLLYTAMIVMALVIVGKSLSELFMTPDDEREHQMHHHHHLHKHHHHEKDWSEDHNAGRWLPDYGLAAFLLTVWLAPIFALLSLPGPSTMANGDDRMDSFRSDATGMESIAYDDDEGCVDNSDNTYDDDAELNEDSYLLTHADTPLESTFPIDVEQHVTEDVLRQEPPKNTLQYLPAELNLVQMLQTPAAWLMLYTTTVIIGSGTVEMNNMAQMAESLGFDSQVTPASLALFSVSQAMGRVVTGAISDSTMKAGVPRPFFLVLASMAGLIAHGILASTSDELWFVLGVALAGIAFGMVWPMIVLICGDLFGNAHLGANYMLYDGFTLAMGTLLLSKLLTQSVYEAHIDPETSPDKTTCIGTACFQLTHGIIAAALFTCVLTSGALLYITRHVYPQPNKNKKRWSSFGGRGHR